MHCVAARPHRGLGVAFEFALGVGDGVSPFSLTYLRLVSQWMTYVSRSALNDSKSVHLLPLKNSSFRCPKTCSVAPLSMQLPFRDILCTMPARSSLPVHAACWYCRPMSLWSIGLAPSGIFAGMDIIAPSMRAVSECRGNRRCRIVTFDMTPSKDAEQLLYLGCTPERVRGRPDQAAYERHRSCPPPILKEDAEHDAIYEKGHASGRKTSGCPGKTPPSFASQRTRVVSGGLPHLIFWMGPAIVSWNWMLCTGNSWCEDESRSNDGNKDGTACLRR